MDSLLVHPQGLCEDASAVGTTIGSCGRGRGTVVGRLVQNVFIQCTAPHIARSAPLRGAHAAGRALQELLESACVKCARMEHATSGCSKRAAKRMFFVFFVFFMACGGC